MKQIVHVVMVGALTTFAASTLTLAQTATKPPPKPASAAKPASTAPTARSVAHPVVRHPVFVPAPPVIELDEMAVAPDLPTVLTAEDRDPYRRIFQAQPSSQCAPPPP